MALLVMAWYGGWAADSGSSTAAGTTALVWSDPIQSQDVPWNAKSATATFHYANPTPRPVRIVIDSGCGCLATDPTPNPVPAGATGAVTVTLPIGFRDGRVSKSITVRTDPPGPAPVSLQFDLNIPVLARVRPGFLHWQVGDPPTPLVVTAAIEPGFPVTITGIKASQSVLSAAWEPNAAHTAGTVRVTPRSTDLPWNGTVVVLTDVGRDFVVFCRCIAPDQPSPVAAPASGHP